MQKVLCHVSKVKCNHYRYSWDFEYELEALFTTKKDLYRLAYLYKATLWSHYGTIGISSKNNWTIKNKVENRFHSGNDFSVEKRNIFL